MADKVKRTSKKNTTKKAAFIVMSREDMLKQILYKQVDLLEARKGHRAGELTNPRVITSTRKEIARLKTAVRADELKGDK